MSVLDVLLEFGCLIEKDIVRFLAQQGLWFAGRYGGRMGGTSDLVVLVRVTDVAHMSECAF